MFENILAELGETAAARLSYSNGLLEIMVPLPEHEVDKIIIGNLIEIILEKLNHEFWCLGSTTLKNDQMSHAVEPDTCFYIEHEAQVRGNKRLDLSQDPPPDLALEIDLTSRTHFDNYEKLGVPELWRYDGKILEIHLLQAGTYRGSKTSLHFPQLSLIEAIPYYVERSKVIGRNAMMREFRRWLAEQLAL
jgi:Uma2 family endonuclease